MGWHSFPSIWGDPGVEPLLDLALRNPAESDRVLKTLLDLATPKAAEAGLRALVTLPPRRQERYREAFLAVLGG